jgi:hypothetical protein
MIAIPFVPARHAVQAEFLCLRSAAIRWQCRRLVLLPDHYPQQLAKNEG